MDLVMRVLAGAEPAGDGACAEHTIIGDGHGSGGLSVARMVRRPAFSLLYPRTMHAPAALLNPGFGRVLPGSRYAPPAVHRGRVAARPLGFAAS
jgi:hypothetical protein